MKMKRTKRESLTRLKSAVEDAIHGELAYAIRAHYKDLKKAGLSDEVIQSIYDPSIDRELALLNCIFKNRFFVEYHTRLHDVRERLEMADEYINDVIDIIDPDLCR